MLVAELTNDQLNLLETIYDVLRREGAWPPYGYLEDFLDTQHGIDIDEVNRSLPPRLTTLPPSPYTPSEQQEVQITIDGLRYVELPGAAADVELFFQIFRRFVTEQRTIRPTVDARPKPCLTTDGLSTELNIHPDTLRRVFRLIALEPWSTGSTPIGDGTNIRICADSRALRRFRAAETVEKYIEFRSQFYAPRPLPSEAAPLWDVLRSGADRLAADAGVGDDLRAIANAASSSNASEWEGALLRCRNVLNKVSQYLYQAPGDTYTPLPGGTGTGPMRVDGDNYRNRLIAYMHQNDLNQKDRKLAEAHLGYFKVFVDQVNQLGSRGKHVVDQRAAANGLVHTYLLLSEIAERTGGQPITELK